jgi:hypothetical protein
VQKKTAPGIPRTVLQEPKLNQKLGSSLLKQAALFLCAIGTNLNGGAEIKAEHAHKALGIHSGTVVANQNTEGLNGGQLYKFLHIFKAAQRYIKLFHGILPPCAVQKQNFRV